MENLAESHNDTRLVIKHGLTSSEDKYGNLGFRGSGYYSLLYYVDSK